MVVASAAASRCGDETMPKILLNSHRVPHLPPRQYYRASTSRYCAVDAGPIFLFRNDSLDCDSLFMADKKPAQWLVDAMRREKQSGSDTTWVPLLPQECTRQLSIPASREISPHVGSRRDRSAFQVAATSRISTPNAHDLLPQALSPWLNLHFNVLFTNARASGNDVYVARSSVAGYGLFAVRDIAPGFALGRYTGKRLTTAQRNEAERLRENTSYMLHVVGDICESEAAGGHAQSDQVVEHYVDGNYARYPDLCSVMCIINGTKQKDQANVTIDEYAVVRTCRAVAKDTEFLLCTIYGEGMNRSTPQRDVAVTPASQWNGLLSRVTVDRSDAAVQWGGIRPPFVPPISLNVVRPWKSIATVSSVSCCVGERMWQKLYGVSLCPSEAQRDGMTTMGTKMAETLVRDAMLHTTPADGVRELVSNAADSGHRSGMRIGQFGTGFFSALSLLDSHGHRRVYVHTKRIIIAFRRDPTSDHILFHASAVSEAHPSFAGTRVVVSDRALCDARQPPDLPSQVTLTHGGRSAEESGFGQSFIRWVLTQLEQFTSLETGSVRLWAVVEGHRETHQSPWWIPVNSRSHCDGTTGTLWVVPHRTRPVFSGALREIYAQRASSGLTHWYGLEGNLVETDRFQNKSLPGFHTEGTDPGTVVRSAQPARGVEIHIGKEGAFAEEFFIIQLSMEVENTVEDDSIRNGTLVAQVCHRRSRMFRTYIVMDADTTVTVYCPTAFDFSAPGVRRCLVHWPEYVNIYRDLVGTTSSDVEPTLSPRWYSNTSTERTGVPMPEPQSLEEVVGVHKLMTASRVYAEKEYEVEHEEVEEEVGAPQNSHVVVRISPHGIVVSDHGCGMTQEDIFSSLLRPGATSKKPIKKHTGRVHAAFSFACPTPRILLPAPEVLSWWSGGDSRPAFQVTVSGVRVVHLPVPDSPEQHAGWRLVLALDDNAWLPVTRQDIILRPGTPTTDAIFDAIREFAGWLLDRSEGAQIVFFLRALDAYERFTANEHIRGILTETARNAVRRKLSEDSSLVPIPIAGRGPHVFRALCEYSLFRHQFANRKLVPLPWDLTQFSYGRLSDELVRAVVSHVNEDGGVDDIGFSLGISQRDLVRRAALGEFGIRIIVVPPSCLATHTHVFEDPLPSYPYTALNDPILVSFPNASAVSTDNAFVAAVQRQLHHPHWKHQFWVPATVTGEDVGKHFGLSGYSPPQSLLTRVFSLYWMTAEDPDREVHSPDISKERRLALLEQAHTLTHVREVYEWVEGQVRILPSLREPLLNFATQMLITKHAAGPSHVRRKEFVFVPGLWQCRIGDGVDRRVTWEAEVMLLKDRLNSSGGGVDDVVFQRACDNLESFVLASLSDRTKIIVHEAANPSRPRLRDNTMWFPTAAVWGPMSLALRAIHNGVTTFTVLNALAVANSVAEADFLLAALAMTESSVNLTTHELDDALMHFARQAAGGSIMCALEAEGAIIEATATSRDVDALFNEVIAPHKDVLLSIARYWTCHRIRTLSVQRVQHGEGRKRPRGYEPPCPPSHIQDESSICTTAWTLYRFFSLVEDSTPPNAAREAMTWLAEQSRTAFKPLTDCCGSNCFANSQQLVTLASSRSTERPFIVAATLELVANALDAETHCTTPPPPVQVSWTVQPAHSGSPGMEQLVLKVVDAAGGIAPKALLHDLAVPFHSGKFQSQQHHPTSSVVGRMGNGFFQTYTDAEKVDVLTWSWDKEPFLLSVEDVPMREDGDGGGGSIVDIQKTFRLCDVTGSDCDAHTGGTAVTVTTLPHHPLHIKAMEKVLGNFVDTRLRAVNAPKERICVNGHRIRQADSFAPLHRDLTRGFEVHRWTRTATNTPETSVILIGCVPYADVKDLGLVEESGTLFDATRLRYPSRSHQSCAEFLRHDLVITVPPSEAEVVQSRTHTRIRCTNALLNAVKAAHANETLLRPLVDGQQPDWPELEFEWTSGVAADGENQDIVSKTFIIDSSPKRIRPPEGITTAFTAARSSDTSIVPSTAQNWSAWLSFRESSLRPFVSLCSNGTLVIRTPITETLSARASRDARVSSRIEEEEGEEAEMIGGPVPSVSQYPLPMSAEGVPRLHPSAVVLDHNPCTVLRVLSERYSAKIRAVAHELLVQWNAHGADFRRCSTTTEAFDIVARLTAMAIPIDSFGSVDTRVDNIIREYESKKDAVHLAFMQSCAESINIAGHGGSWPTAPERRDMCVLHAFRARAMLGAYRSVFIDSMIACSIVERCARRGAVHSDNPDTIVLTSDGADVKVMTTDDYRRDVVRNLFSRLVELGALVHPSDASVQRKCQKLIRASDYLCAKANATVCKALRFEYGTAKALFSALGFDGAPSSAPPGFQQLWISIQNKEIRPVIPRSSTRHILTTIERRWSNVPSHESVAAEVGNWMALFWDFVGDSSVVPSSLLVDDGSGGPYEEDTLLSIPNTTPTYISCDNGDAVDRWYNSLQKRWTQCTIRALLAHSKSFRRVLQRTASPIAANLWSKYQLMERQRGWLFRDAEHRTGISLPTLPHISLVSCFESE